jgi:hypothetical protein
MEISSERENKRLAGEAHDKGPEPGCMIDSRY